MHVGRPAGVGQPLFVRREIRRDNAPPRVEALDGFDRFRGTLEGLVAAGRATEDVAPAPAEHVVLQIREVLLMVNFGICAFFLFYFFFREIIISIASYYILITNGTKEKHKSRASQREYGVHAAKISVHG